MVAKAAQTEVFKGCFFDLVADMKSVRFLILKVFFYFQRSLFRYFFETASEFKTGHREDGSS